MPTHRPAPIQESAGFVASTASWAEEAARRQADAVLAADVETLEELLDEASRRRAVEPASAATLRVVAAGIDQALMRLTPRFAVQRLAVGSAEARMMAYVAVHPDCTNSDLSEALGLADATVSRAGGVLQAEGLVVRSRAGKFKRWQVTPAGQHALGAVDGDLDPRLAVQRTALLAQVLRDAELADVSGVHAEVPDSGGWAAEQTRQAEAERRLAQRTPDPAF